jgi:hypothetical protein
LAIFTFTLFIENPNCSIYSSNVMRHNLFMNIILICYFSGTLKFCRVFKEFIHLSLKSLFILRNLLAVFYFYSVLFSCC